MTKSEPLRRYIFIINKLSTNQKPSLAQILDFLASHDLNISERTLQRDIEALRTNFGLDVLYDASDKGYYLHINQRFPLDNFMRVARLRLRSELLMETIYDLQHNQDFISFDSSEMLKGIEHLEPFLEAIRSKWIATFTYTKFTDSVSKKHKVKPYHLKEYKGRWYLLAMTNKGLTTFALDRLERLQITSETFKREAKIDPKEGFQNQIGISWGDEQPVDVRLLFTKDQANYIKTLPWHYSQEIIKEDKRGVEVGLHITLNFELTHLIVALGDSVKVLAPISLVNEVKAIHKSSFGQY